MTVMADLDGSLGQSTSVKANSNSSSSSVRENKSQVSSQDATLKTARKPEIIVIFSKFIYGVRFYPRLQLRGLLQSKSGDIILTE